MKLDLNTLRQTWANIADSASRAWFDEQQQHASGDDLNRLDVSLAMARRKVGHAALAEEGGGFKQWNVADVARVLLLAEAKAQHGHAVIQRAYRQGDEYEREAILKGLSLLDAEGALHDLAVDACRTNVLTMLAAIAMDNPYPARFFSEHEFNQMVLKCLFLGFDVGAVSGLSARQNPAMSRMCYDYLRERRAAGRDFPVSLWLTIRVRDVPEATAQFDEYLRQGSEAHRRYATRAVLQQAQIAHSDNILAVLTSLSGA